MKYVKKATVEIVRGSSLKPGDKILYSNIVLTFKEWDDMILPLFKRPLKCYQGNPVYVTSVGPFSRYYRIIDMIEYNGCVSCEREIDIDAGDRFDMCDQCYVKNIMGSYEDPETGKRWTDEDIETALTDWEDSYR